VFLLDNGRFFHIDWAPRLKKVVSPENSPLEYLTVFSLKLSKGELFEREFTDEEAGFYVIEGTCEVESPQGNVILKPHDTVFVGGTKLRIRALDDLKAIISTAPSPVKDVLEIVKIDDAVKDPKLFRTAGGENFTRDVVTMIGDNIEGARLLAGYTWVRKGNWSSWPPHEHGDLMEEVYIFYYLPPPGYGIQLVYESLEDLKMFLVRQDDLVVIDRGYHPNVAAPGFEMKYLWVISARRAFKDRIYGAWKVHPDFKS